MLSSNLAIKLLMHWNTAIYVRISEEERIKSLGDSISNQKQILNQYALKNELNVVGIYADEGKKGGNFNRPAFKNMINEIEKGDYKLCSCKRLI